MIKKIIILLIILLSIGCAFSANEFEFKIIIDHQFDDNDEITCELEYDDQQDTIIFDKNSDDNDLEIIEKFNDFLDFNCDDNLETIRLYVYDQDNNRVFKETYSNEDKFDYELELVDKEEQYFVFDIKSDITSNIDCELSIDGGDYEYDFSFDQDTNNNDLEFARNFDDDFILECDDEIEEIDLTVYNEDGDVIYDKTYFEKEIIEFDINDALEKNEFRIEIEHNFASDEEIKCDLEIDENNNLDEDFVFDSQSSNSEFTIIREFKDNFIFDCNENLDEITIRIYDELGDKVDQEIYDNEDNVEYEFNEGQFDFMIEITNEFTNNVRCELVVDDRDKIKYDFEEKSARSDKRIEDDFNQYITFSCEEELDKVEIFVFSDDEDNNGDLLEQKAYNSKSLIEFTYGTVAQKQNDEDKEPVQIKEKEEGINTQTPSEPGITDEDITSNINTSNLVDNGNSQENTVSINATEIQQTNITNNETVTNETMEPPKSLGVMLFIIFLIIVIVVLILGALKAKQSATKRKPKRKDKVDLEFLKNRK